MYVATIKIHQVINLKVSKLGCVGWFGGRKGRDNDVIVLYYKRKW